MKDFQLGHFEDRETIKNPRHDSKACWMNLAILFLDKTEHRLPSNNFLLESFIEPHPGIG
jgi:hypothetical protein